MKPNIKIFKIFYDDRSRRSIEAPYIPLDNTSGKSGWFELWPILLYLEENTLDEDTWYGFLSPKFSSKLGIGYEDIEELIARSPGANVALFSANWTTLTLWRNPWLHGDHWHPGVIERTERFLKSRDEQANLRSIVCTLNDSVFANYVVAKPAYWRAWKTIARDYLDYAEALGPHAPDNQMTVYKGQDSYQLRVFIQERLANWILHTNEFQVVHPDYFKSISIIDLVKDGSESPLLRHALRLAEAIKVWARRGGGKPALALHAGLVKAIRMLHFTRYKLRRLRLKLAS